ncbi:unnamed protein product [Ostreobium quekettii]|uniref:N-alpha-acetyltransferase 60 n=1 Tax=Ostreobium quekettii TaxID=121088 RepID=A0A8S1IUC9_9CHLO|nr:unnamed protein product [Ostreobium quekettii]|eukprot:evm.model.scf_191.15 EVM.evm.TU.scf_191.15   scf_191:104386-107547(-)
MGLVRGDRESATLAMQPPGSVQHVLRHPNILYRSLLPEDFVALRAAHVDLFPIDYDDSFFDKAVNGLTRIISYAAVDYSSGSEKLVGFVTARVLPLVEVDPMDRRHMGLDHSSLNGLRVVYILTLGVLPEYQRLGIATKLIDWLEDCAACMGASVVFLHVISYNQAAMLLYQKSCFRCVACMENFYCIRSGRQINPNQTRYDAYLFMKWVGEELHKPGPWEGAIAPFRHAFAQWNACLPWLCRDQLFLAGPTHVAGDSSNPLNAAVREQPSFAHHGIDQNSMFYRLFKRSH